MDTPHLICVTYCHLWFVMLPTTLFETEMTTISQDVAYRYTNLRSSRLSYIFRTVLTMTPASCSFIDQPCFNIFSSSLVILSDCSVNCLECPSITSCLMVICWRLTVSIRGLMLLSTHDWILDYHRYNSFGNTGIILSSTSVLVRASMTLSVTFCLWTGGLVVFFITLSQISNRAPAKHLSSFLHLCGR